MSAGAVMSPWRERAPEEANLFNPAFCAVLIAKSADEFFKKAAKPLPFPLVFLVLPIVLHPGTREALPGSTVTSMLTWLQEHRGVLVGFPTRARRLRPITQEAVMFGMTHRALALGGSGGVVVGAEKVRTTEKAMEHFTPDARGCVDRARFLGRWLAAAGTPATVMSAWGVAP